MDTESGGWSVVVEGYPHTTGEHCASTALRNILRFHGTELSEGMIVGLSSGLGFYYLALPGASPTRMFHGRTLTLESDFCANAGIPFVERTVEDAQEAWQTVKRKIDAGLPVILSTDTFYLGYHHTTSHFPGHRAVLVGYDEASQTVAIADRKFEAYQRCSYDELRRARNADDYPMRCDNLYGDFTGEVKLGRPLAEAIRIAMRRNAQWMRLASPEAITGVGAMRRLAHEFPSWSELEDWSWAARFGYQVIVKRGAGGHFFRSLYADFLDEAAALVPSIGDARLPERMRDIARSWLDLADCLEAQSERETCDPKLFDRAARCTVGLADAEEAFFTAQAELVEVDAAWPRTWPPAMRLER